MASAIVAAGAWIAANTAVAVAIAVSIASVGFSMINAQKMKSRGQQERKQILRSSAAPCNVVIGKNRSAGVLSYAVEETDKQDEYEDVYLVVTHASHPLHKVDNYKLNDEALDDIENIYHLPDRTLSSGIVNYWKQGNIFWPSGKKKEETIELCSYDQGATAADPTLLDKASDWKTDMIGTDISWYWIRLAYDQKQWPTGLPNITAEKWGIEVEDIRTGTVGWTDNNALIILWYLRTHLKYEDDELLLETFKTAANICDETVTNNDGTTEPRYTIGGEFEVNEEPAAILDKMLASCAGEWVRIGGRLGLTVGAYYGPATITISEDDLIGAVELQPEVELGDAANIVRGTYIDPKQDYNEVDYPEVRISDWVSADGEDIVDDQNYEFVQSGWQAQRLANIHLMRKRHGMKLKLPCNLRAFGAVPGTYVKLQLSSIGIEGITCRVLDWAFAESDGVTLMVRRELASMYDDAVGIAPYIPPIVTAPPAPVAPSQITAVPDGQNIRLSWQNHARQLKQTLVRVYKTTSSQSPEQSLAVAAPGNTLVISALVATEYTFELLAETMAGRLSLPARKTVNIAGPSQPTEIEVETGPDWVQLNPSYTGGLPTGTALEYYLRGRNPKGERKLQNVTAGSYRFIGLEADTLYYFSVRSRDSFGVSDYLEVSAQTSLAGQTQVPTTPQNVQFQPTFTNILVSWDRVEAINSWYSYTEIWRQAVTLDDAGQPQHTPNFSAATLVWSGVGGNHTDAVAANSSHYYWVRHINIAGQPGPLHATDGTLVTTYANPRDVLEAYSDDITKNPLTGFLQSELSFADWLQRNYDAALGGDSVLHGWLTDTQSAVDRLAEQQMLNATQTKKQTRELAQSIGNSSAAIRQELDVVVGPDSAFAKAVTELHSQLNDPKTGLAYSVANIRQQLTTLATPDSSMTHRVDRIESALDTNGDGSFDRLASIETDQTTLATEQMSLAKEIKKIRVSMGGENGEPENYAEYQKKIDAVVLKDKGSYILDSTKLSVGFNGKEASIEEVVSAIVGEKGNADAMWAMKTSVDGMTGGIGLYNDGKGVYFTVAANNFAVIPPGIGSKPDLTGKDKSLLPFGVVDGKTVIKSAYIDHASIYKLIAKNVVAEKIAATVELKSPTIKGGTIQIGDNFKVDRQGNATAKNISLINGSLRLGKSHIGDSKKGCILTPSGAVEIGNPLAPGGHGIKWNPTNNKLILNGEGEFRGRIYVEDLVGDVIDCRVYPISNVIVGRHHDGKSIYNLFTCRITPSRLPRNLVLASLEWTAKKRREGGHSGGGAVIIQMRQNGGAWADVVHSGVPRDHTISQKGLVHFPTISIPKNKSLTIDFRAITGSKSANVSPVSKSIFAQLFVSTGGSLS